MADNLPGPKRRGPPLGSQNGRTHGLRCLQNEIKRRARRGRSLIDRRSKAGQNAIAVRQQIVQDLGGEKSLSAAQLTLVEMVGRDVYFLDETDRRIFKIIYHTNVRYKQQGIKGYKSPKFIATLYGYRTAIARNLAANLQLLGLDRKPPPIKTLEVILAEGESAENDSQPESEGES